MISGLTIFATIHFNQTASEICAYVLVAGQMVYFGNAIELEKIT